MSISLLIANTLTLLAFFVHAIMGDRELKIIEPVDNAKNKQEKWTMARCGWHWISIDLLFASVGLTLVIFTDFFENERTLLQILSVYFLSYSIAWLVTVLISKPFERNFLKLGQWMLLLLISGLIFFGIQ